MGRVPKALACRKAVSIERDERDRCGLRTPEEARDIAKHRNWAKQWAKHQGHALDQQNAWARVRSRRTDQTRPNPSRLPCST